MLELFLVFLGIGILISVLNCEELGGVVSGFWVVRYWHWLGFWIVVKDFVWYWWSFCVLIDNLLWWEVETREREVSGRILDFNRLHLNGIPILVIISRNIKEARVIRHNKVTHHHHNMSKNNRVICPSKVSRLSLIIPLLEIRGGLIEGILGLLMTTNL